MQVFWLQEDRAGKSSPHWKGKVKMERTPIPWSTEKCFSADGDAEQCANEHVLHTMGAEHTIDVGTWLHPVPKQDGSCCHSDRHDHISPRGCLLGRGADPHGATDGTGKLQGLLLGAIPYPDLHREKQGKPNQNEDRLTWRISPCWNRTLGLSFQ